MTETRLRTNEPAQETRWYSLVKLVAQMGGAADKTNAATRGCATVRSGLAQREAELQLDSGRLQCASQHCGNHVGTQTVRVECG